MSKPYRRIKKTYWTVYYERNGKATWARLFETKKEAENWKEELERQSRNRMLYREGALTNFRVGKKIKSELIWDNQKIPKCVSYV